MFRNDSDKLKHGVTNLNCLIADGGLGDLLCSLMAVNYILENCPWVNLLIWVPDYMKEFSKHVLKSGAIVRNYTEAKTKYDDSKPGISTKWNSQHTPMGTNAVRYAYHMLCDFSPTVEQCSYLKIRPNEINISKFNLPNNYVVMQATYVEKVKTMPGNTFNDIVDYLIDKGYNIVFIGKTNSTTGANGMSIKADLNKSYNLNRGINLVDKTSLLESAAILNQAKAFITMDGGSTHLAGFTDVPIFCAYTFASPSQLMPIRGDKEGKDVYPIIPDASLGCRFCQSNLKLYFNHDFRNCFYKDYACVSQITSQKFINELEKIL